MNGISHVTLKNCFTTNALRMSKLFRSSVGPRNSQSKMMTFYQILVMYMFLIVNYPFRYYYSDVGDTQSLIVLGDFGVDGWRMCKDKVNLSLEHILLSSEYIYIQI